MTPSNPSIGHPLLQRRRVLALPWAALLSGAGLAPVRASAADASGGRLVLVFLRGAVDGLSVFVPHADPHYRQLRRDTAIPIPDGTGQTALALDDHFGLHPALAPLWPLWKQGSLTFIPAAGLPRVNRSHFEAQNQWEIGTPDVQRTANGWLNTWAYAAAPGAPTPTVIGVGEANPAILSGNAAVKLVPRGRGALGTGALTGDRTRRALLDLYADEPQLGAPFMQGARSRIETAQMLSQVNAMAPEMAFNNGAGPPEALALDARHLATLMRNDLRLRVGFLSAGGWDTHARQGGVTGTLANALSRLALALHELHHAFSRPDDLVVVVSEFGRTCAENGTGGTDHGYGNAIWLMGPRVNGGHWHGRWEGLAPGQLHEGRDLPVFHDFRAVLSLLLRETQGATDAQLAGVFPGNPFAGSELLSGDNRAMAGLLRA